MTGPMTLAIETAVGGGSLSLLANDSEIDFWIGEGEALRAENILVYISELLSRNGLQQSDIKIIVYSEGPGSHTGIRIGAAVARGLRAALQCDCRSETIFRALAQKAMTKAFICSAIQISQKEVWWQIFEKKGDNLFLIKTAPQLVSNDIFHLKITNSEEIVWLSNGRNFSEVFEMEDNLFELERRNISVVETTQNIAYLVGLASMSVFVEES
jgi:tRNA threonylcarbamoyl adenosine modification protein YeaZ